mmetsp:Transcript_7324/g.10790  ORF Transcript_7324/g.10790 Transcript_7324/m.10790 type:complete len:206 (-) Transcript_7324:211-828(-)
MVVLHSIYNALYKLVGDSRDDKSNIYRLEETLELPALPLDLFEHFSTLGVFQKKMVDIRTPKDKTNTSQCQNSIAVARECLQRYETTYKGQRVTVTPDDEVNPLSIEEMEEADEETLDKMYLTARKNAVCSRYMNLVARSCPFHEYEHYIKEIERGVFVGINGFTSWKRGQNPTEILVDEDHKIVSIINQAENAEHPLKVGGHVH